MYYLIVVSQLFTVINILYKAVTYHIRMCLFWSCLGGILIQQFIDLWWWQSITYFNILNKQYLSPSLLCFCWIFFVLKTHLDCGNTTKSRESSIGKWDAREWRNTMIVLEIIRRLRYERWNIIVGSSGKERDGKTFEHGIRHLSTSMAALKIAHYWHYIPENLSFPFEGKRKRQSRIFLAECLHKLFAS